MSEFEDRLNAILSSPETMEQIASLASTLQVGDGGPKGGEAPPREEATPAGLGALLSGLDPAMLGRLAPLLTECQAGEPEKQALLQALKPFLRPESQQKVEKAMHLTRLSKLLRNCITLFREGGNV